LPVDAGVTYTARIDRSTWKFIFYVAEDLMHPVIFGSDLLEKTRLFVDMQEDLVVFFTPLINYLCLGAVLLLI
jgi:hypothetical protein